jgi:mannose-6-phosphate isomerase-like protein (cupin superfamily)
MDAAEIAKLPPDERERFHQDAEGRVHSFQYRKPDDNGRVKQLAWLAKSKRIYALVQVVKEGGENNLHYHTHSDQVWMVLKGQARFYGPNNHLLGEYGPSDGLMVPEGARYWFEKCGNEDLEILQLVAFDDHGSEGSERVNIAPMREWMSDPTLKV